MASIWMLHLHSPSSLPLRPLSDELNRRSELGLDFGNYTKWSRKVECRKFVVRADSSDSDKDSVPKFLKLPLAKLQESVVVVQKLKIDDVQKFYREPLAKLQESISYVPVFVTSKENFKFGGTNITIGLFFLASVVVILVRGFAARKSRDSRPPGSVADLVRRGQLKSDRRGISTPLKYEDPFNNPMIKVSKSNSTVEMCGKVYKLAPVTLTNEQQNVHQRRRSRAYQWKRPTTFLKEGDPIPPDVDPDTVRWIPANHPFATTSSDIDEDLAQNNVYQKHGVPFRIKAEHEALQKKLEALQNDQKLNKLAIDPAVARDFERPLTMKSENPANGGSNLVSGSNQSASDRTNSSLNKQPSEENRES